MKHQVLLFAGLRETARRDAVELDLPAGARVLDLLEAMQRSVPELAQQLRHCRVAVDHEFVDGEHVLAPQVEIALIPPVSGGHDGPPNIELSAAPLRLERVIEAVDHPNAGGIATFTGNVRRLSRGIEVDHLEYEAYGTMAVRAMERIVTQIEGEIPGVRVAIHHRVGRLEVGDTAVVIAASAPHRAEAFTACRAAIEALKRDVPIWKKEVGRDGSAWIGQGP